jgi:ring-1,2-phenylacetyl-CoA epoxidase subunit PaaE
MELLQWKIIQVIRETDDAATYLLQETGGKEVTYKAGQFLTFIFYHHEHEIRRSYSIASAPGVDPYIAITVKKKENGLISRYILMNWHEGTPVSSLPPAGRFTIDANPQFIQPVVFIAAGSGIVPVYALIKSILREAPRCHITLIYQNYNEYRIIYHEALQALQQQYAGRFQRIDLLSNPISHGIQPQRLNNALLEKLVDQLVVGGDRLSTDSRLQTTDSRLLFYTCGPAAFMRMVQFTLRVMGYEESQLRKENFTIDHIPVPIFTMSTEPRQVTLHEGNRTHQFTVAYPVTILQAALDKHINLSYSCRAGKCSACAATCLQGKIKMSYNEVLTEQDLAQGLVLTCVGYAETDVELRV